MLPAMRLMGIDYGTKRVGIALSDPDGCMAFPHETLPNDAQLQEQLEKLIDSMEVGCVVFGHSFDREGMPNMVHEDAAACADRLHAETGVAVAWEDERYTTKEALRLQGKTDKTDASAAALMLNAYIQKHNQ